MSPHCTWSFWQIISIVFLKLTFKHLLHSNTFTQSLNIYSLTEETPIICAEDHGVKERGEVFAPTVRTECVMTNTSHVFHS